MREIDWKAIRPCKGSQSGGFEELCAQLARSESPSAAKFDRKGSPDAGVECFSVFPDGSEWGWQAKYFFSLGNTQMQELDSSVRTALDKHPNLVCYVVCAPMDRPDARAPGRKSALQRWESHVKKWAGWAQERCMNVEFVWWGSSELIDRLSRNEHVGRRRYWFGQQGFDQDWFCSRLNESIKAAGARYTPEIHVDLPIARDLDRFSRSDRTFTEVKSLAVGIRRARQGLAHASRSLEDPSLRSDVDYLSKTTGSVLDALNELEPCPFGPLPFPKVVKTAEQARTAVSQVLDRMGELHREREIDARDDRTSPGYYDDPWRSLRFYLNSLQSELQKLVGKCNRADSLADSQILLLKGDGGTGKTHLLCDFAKSRVFNQLPTILLMGQRFLTSDEPWAQALQLLDLASTNAEEVVGALEAAAQASGCRALVIVDALNEGNGRKIWRPHLSAFLGRATKSPWIGVIISVRSSYEKVMIPEDVMASAKHVIHRGFAGHEYDAVKAFFAHYGLEFPSAPILHPEFSNPLFLKTFCKGLQESGERRIPKGFNGITTAFNLYLKGINDRLASPEFLDFDARDDLVRKALNGIAERLAANGTRWLSRTDARTIVDTFLPGRDYSQSLFSALVAEGILTEDVDRWSEGTPEAVVFITYDRFADHVICDHLLSAFLDADDPQSAFSKDGRLAYICDEERYIQRGLIEALSIQLPERTGKELMRLVPNALDYTDFARAFLHSIIWRKHEAISDDTLAVLDELDQREDFADYLLEALMSLSTIPGHPLNADWFHSRLGQDKMPDRDSWWSTYLHRAWGTEGPVDRLVDWASDLSVDDELEDGVVDLAATTLAWMFATPNRFLRDRATKALVVLLTNRMEAVERLVNRFADVDDLYVAERVYASAYGVAMRSHDAKAVGELAEKVYERVFASGAPPAHILLRDYARGVIERAIRLGSSIDIKEDLIRPPYFSNWPDIPNEDVVNTLTPKWERGAWDDGDLEWSRNQIRHSVMGEVLGDFAHYVIGTDFKSNWLILRIHEEAWQSPGQRLQALISKFSEPEILAWDAYQLAKSKVPPIVDFVDEAGKVAKTWNVVSSAFDQHTVELARAKAQLAHGRLIAELTEEHRIEWDVISRDMKDFTVTEGPRFDTRLVQRYIVWRVFDLGWTVERFGRFDRFDVPNMGRTAAKAERMGKKYQWIAYHEILAYVADNFQYREKYVEDSFLCKYEGPWQESLRDIDPSLTLQSLPGGTSWGSHDPSWWAREHYESWDEDASHRDWLARCHGLPVMEKLLDVVNPVDGTRWLNGNGSFGWRQSYPVDQEPYEHARRELGIGFTGYFVRAEEAESFMSWARTVDFWGRWMPEPRESYSTYLGEYGWAPAYEQSLPDGSGFDDSARPTSPDGKVCPVAIRPVSFVYTAEGGGFDCSVKDHITLRLPHYDFIRSLDLRPSHSGADFVNPTGTLVAFDPTAHETGPNALLLNKEFLEIYLREQDLAICWVVLGEKMLVGGNPGGEFRGRAKMSGAYRITEDGLAGFLKYTPDIPEDDAPRV